MIQPRALQPTPDLCCLPSPYRILQGVAGMAFNFSRIELSHRVVPRKAAASQDRTQPPRGLLTALRG
ncbi:MAG TPA: hypothetical protein VG714_03145 [Acidobacteriaceae bacterium]|nr:hypothetical protein [Acidobacteriaceae bacterium]